MNWRSVSDTQTEVGELYLFGGVGGLGEDGLPVRPHKHDEGEVEEGQVDDWKGVGGETDEERKQASMCADTEHKLTHRNATAT